MWVKPQTTNPVLMTSLGKLTWNKVIIFGLSQVVTVIKRGPSSLLQMKAYSQGGVIHF